MSILTRKTMIIHHFRNATMLIEVAGKRILVDPMLGPAHSGTPFSFFRYKPIRNPLVPFPERMRPLLEQNIDYCLISHAQHPDHLDKEGIAYLRAKDIPVACSAKERKMDTKKGLRVTLPLEPWVPQPFLGGTITAIPAVHGYGWIHYPMGDVVGFFLQFAGEPSLYISADTIMTEDVRRALRELHPDISVVAAGTARLDIGKPLLMTVPEILEFVRLAPGRVLANHLEALNHCPTTRLQLHQALQGAGLREKVDIPDDGSTLEYPPA